MTIRYGMVGGGPGAFIGAVHRLAAALPVVDEHSDAHRPVDRFEIERLTGLAVPLHGHLLGGQVGDRLTVGVDDADK